MFENIKKDLKRQLLYEHPKSSVPSMNRFMTALIVSPGKVRRFCGSRNDCIFSRTAPARHETSASWFQVAGGKRSTCAFPAFFLAMVWTRMTLWRNRCCFPSFISSRSRQIPSQSLGTPPRSQRLLSKVSAGRERIGLVNILFLNRHGVRTIQTAVWTSEKTCWLALEELFRHMSLKLQICSHGDVAQLAATPGRKFPPDRMGLEQRYGHTMTG